MGSVHHYDLLILGTGEAGKFIPWVMSSKGKKCAVVERRWLGGSCPSVACLPSKSVIHSAKAHHLNSKRDTFGISKANGEEAAVDMKAVKKQRTAVTTGVVELIDSMFKEKNVDFLWGEGKFTGPKEMEVTNADGKKRTFSADIFIINTGSRAIVHDIPGLKEADPMTHIEMLDIDLLPEHLVILGGGYIGLEFAQAMRRFGSKVTVIEHGEKILKREDDDVASELVAVLQKEGINFQTSTTINKVSGKSGDSVTLEGTEGGKAFKITGSHILCATGRVPNNKNIGIELTGAKLDNKGFVKVDEWNQATKDVFAVGDCAGSPFFTHASLDDYRIVCEYLLDNKISENRRSERQMPFTLFTDPELAHVGLREKEAKAQGLRYRLAKVPMGAFLRTRTLGDTTGFAKAIVSADDDTILGFTALGAGAGELLPVVQLVMKRKLPYTDISNLIIAHPTLNEGLIALFDETPPRS